MLTYTSYSEAGGVGKTTLTANLAKAHVERSHDVLVIDLDQQRGCLSHLLGVDDNRSDPDADTIVHHMVDRPQGEFEDLIRPTEGIDVIPSHDSLEQRDDWLTKAGDYQATTEADDWEFPRNEQLRRVLRENDVPSQYDVIIVDPPATAGPHLYNGIDATRSLVIPLELTGKGDQSVEGLEELVAGLEEQLALEVGVLAVVPNGFKGTSDQDTYLDTVDELTYDVPVVLRERGSLFEGCWRQQCTAFTYVDEHRSRKRDHEMETLEKIRSLAAHLEAEAGLDGGDDT